MTINEQIDGIFGVIDLWASNAVRKRADGDSVYNPYNAKELAVELYNAGYRKIDDDYFDVITKDELKQYKAQAVKEFAERLKTEPRITNSGLEFVALVDIDAELEALLNESEK